VTAGRSFPPGVLLQQLEDAPVRPVHCGNRAVHDALAWIRAGDVQDLKRVVDRLRSGGKVTGTKTLMVLSSSVRRPI
jgi:hypothetical protein